MTRINLVLLKTAKFLENLGFCMFRQRIAHFCGNSLIVRASLGRSIAVSRTRRAMRAEDMNRPRYLKLCIALLRPFPGSPRPRPAKCAAMTHL